MLSASRGKPLDRNGGYSTPRPPASWLSPNQKSVPTPMVRFTAYYDVSCREWLEIGVFNASNSLGSSRIISKFLSTRLVNRITDILLYNKGDNDVINA